MCSAICPHRTRPILLAFIALIGFHSFIMYFFFLLLKEKTSSFLCIKEKLSKESLLVQYLEQ